MSSDPGPGPGFQGDFSFVNVDASSLSTLPHRQRVTRHVHGYRRWKKGQDARRLLESSRFHEAVDPQLKPLKAVPSRASRKERVPPRPAQASPSSARSSIRSLPPLLDVVLLNSNGNSNFGPSSAFQEELTALTSSLLDFERSCVIPAVREVELRMAAKEHVPHQSPFTETWIAGSKAYLYDSIANHSYLSRIAATRYMVTANTVHLDEAHRLRYRGVASLKEYMTTTPHISIPRLYRALLMLLFADSSLGDTQAFYQHVTVLKDILATHQDEVFADPSFNLRHYIGIIYLEVQSAVMNFSTASVDLSPDGWVEKQLLPLWEDVSPYLSTSRSDADRNLDSCLQGDIRALFLDAQEMMDMIAKIRSQNSPSCQAWVYAVSKTIMTVGRLMNFYAHLDVAGTLCQEMRTLMNSATLQKLEVAAATLCAIYWLRELCGIENLRMTEHTRLFAWNPVMLNRLRQILTFYDAAAYMNMSAEQPQISPNPRRRLWLWIVWTGAMAEQSIASSSTSMTVSSSPSYTVNNDEKDGWFTGRFYDLVRETGIGWGSGSQLRSRCQAILERFPQLHFYGIDNIMRTRSGSGNEWMAEWA
ncbi:hypothetical protein FOPE_10318 [Fonsecaea pedrosoi]|nr:hypothetical protein FOPE_10318 [Fonsecaea pedrosoi]